MQNPIIALPPAGSRKRRLAALALAPVAALALFAAPAFASSDDRDDDDVRLGTDVPAADWLSVAEVATRLEAQGLRVSKVEADDGLYEVYFTENGERFEAKVHPATAEILRRERD